MSALHPWLQEGDILFVAPGVCPPAYGTPIHVCKGTFSLLSLTAVFRDASVTDEDGNCRFCGEPL